MNPEQFGFIPSMKLGVVTVFQTFLSDSRLLFKQTNGIWYVLSDTVCVRRLPSGHLSALLLCLIIKELNLLHDFPHPPSLLFPCGTGAGICLPSFITVRHTKRSCCHAIVFITTPHRGQWFLLLLHKWCSYPVHWNTLRKRYKQKLVCSPAQNHTWVSPNLAQAQLCLGSSVKFYSGAFCKNKM